MVAVVSAPLCLERIGFAISQGYTAQHHRVASLHAVLSYFTNDDDRADHATQVFNPGRISKHGLRWQRGAIEQVEAVTFAVRGYPQVRRPPEVPVASLARILKDELTIHQISKLRRICENAGAGRKTEARQKQQADGDALDIKKTLVVLVFISYRNQCHKRFVRVVRIYRAPTDNRPGIAESGR